MKPLDRTCSLQVSWQEALGVADGYILQVMDDRGGLVTNASQLFGNTHYKFDGLTPGKKYKVLVQTTSGGVYSLGVSTEARTRTASSIYLDSTRIIIDRITKQDDGQDFKKSLICQEVKSI